MDSNGFGIARRVGELESWRVGELESWRVGDPRASDSEKTTSLYGRAAAGLGFEHARHALHAQLGVDGPTEPTPGLRTLLFAFCRGMEVL